MTIAQYFANPYDTDATGFYFNSYEEYTSKAAALLNRSGAPVEEFMIDYIDGDDAQLFEACKVDQSNLEFWFDAVEMLEDYQKAALFYLVSINGQNVREALDNLEDVCLSQCDLLEAASELFDECYLGGVPEAVQAYIDYDKFANDCRLSGDMYEFTFNGETYTCTNANS
jgi:hypothetical protein